MAGNADRQRNIDLQFVGLRWHGNGIDQGNRQFVDQFGMPVVDGHNAGEFIAANPGGKSAGRQDSSNPPGALLQHVIADAVAMNVVDLLEAVEVGHQQDNTFAARGASANQFICGDGQAAPVEKASQRVAVGQMFGLHFGLAMHIYLFDKLAIMAPAEQDQRDIEQQGANQQIVRANAVPLHCPDDLLQGPAAGSDKQDDRGSSNAKRNRVARAGPHRVIGVPGCLRSSVNSSSQLAMPPLT